MQDNPNIFFRFSPLHYLSVPFMISKIKTDDHKAADNETSDMR